MCWSPNYIIASLIDIVPPDIISDDTSADVAVQELENATLTCRATGHPAPRITWRREDHEPILLKKPNARDFIKAATVYIKLEFLFHSIKKRMTPRKRKTFLSSTFRWFHLKAFHLFISRSGAGEEKNSMWRGRRGNKERKKRDICEMRIQEKRMREQQRDNKRFKKREKLKSVLDRGREQEQDGECLLLCIKMVFIFDSVESYTGKLLNLWRVDRRQMGAFLCIASNDVPPAVSKRITLSVNCENPAHALFNTLNCRLPFVSIEYGLTLKQCFAFVRERRMISSARSNAHGKLLFALKCFEPNVAPTVKVPNQLLGAPLGTDVKLKCHVEAYPNTINYWLKNRGEMLLDGPKYTIREEKLSYKVSMWLTIRQFSRSDIGTYNCVSTNSLGKSEGTLRLYGSIEKRHRHLQLREHQLAGEERGDAQALRIEKRHRHLQLREHQLAGEERGDAQALRDIATYNCVSIDSLGKSESMLRVYGSIKKRHRHLQLREHRLAGKEREDAQALRYNWVSNNALRKSEERRCRLHLRSRGRRDIDTYNCVIINLLKNIEERLNSFKTDQLDWSNLDQSNQNGTDLKICSRSEALPSGQLCYFLTSILEPYRNGRRYLVPVSDYHQRSAALPS
ncbi:Hemicentin-1 [Eumeta japonica]|uniref:Hemicentin-1 n=1 Tax=Eumeta variegata TaxID=151549 RepID=A0A4C1UCQ7_EUMVA|nr:Hemicentin-1 [Eumeta japonica]